MKIMMELNEEDIIEAIGAYLRCHGDTIGTITLHAEALRDDADRRSGVYRLTAQVEVERASNT